MKEENDLVKAVFLDTDGTLMDTNYCISRPGRRPSEVERGRRARGFTTRWARAPTS